MPDFGLLKPALFRSILQQDVKPLARALMMDALGNFNRVLTASEERLHQIKGVRDTVITDLKILEACTHRMASTGDATVRDFGPGCVAGLLPRHDSALRDRAVSCVLSGSQERADSGRGPGQGHGGGSRPRLPARGSKAGAAVERLGFDPDA